MYRISRIAPLSMSACLLLCSFGCRGSSERGPSETNLGDVNEEELVALMEEHYRSAIASHEAAIAGDLDSLRRHLGELEAQVLPPGAPEDWRPFDQRLREVARGASSVLDPESAARAMSDLAEACAACHIATGVEQVYPRQTFPEGSGQETMPAHHWASERLWEGVAGPSDEAWLVGAEMLARTHVFDQAPETIMVGAESLRAREAALREIGSIALAALGPHERAVAYGHLLSTCASCHIAAGVTLPERDPVAAEQRAEPR